MVTKKRQSKLSGPKSKKVSQNHSKNVKGGKSKGRSNTNSKNKKNKKNKLSNKNHGKKSSRKGSNGGTRKTKKMKKKALEQDGGRVPSDDELHRIYPQSNTITNLITTLMSKIKNTTDIDEVASHTKFVIDKINEKNPDLKSQVDYFKMILINCKTLTKEIFYKVKDIIIKKMDIYIQRKINMNKYNNNNEATEAIGKLYNLLREVNNIYPEDDDISSGDIIYQYGINILKNKADLEQIKKLTKAALAKLYSRNNQLENFMLMELNARTLTEPVTYLGLERYNEAKKIIISYLEKLKNSIPKSEIEGLLNDNNNPEIKKITAFIKNIESVYNNKQQELKKKST